MRWSETDQSADERNWIGLVSSKQWSLRAYDSSLSSSVPAISVVRGSGTNLTGLTLHPEVTLASGSILSPANLGLAPVGDLILSPTGNDVLPSVGYTKNLGALNNKFLTLHAAELWVETLVAQNTIATIGGRVLVGPTTTLTADLGTGATSITTKHNQMTSGDRLYLEANGKVEFLAVTSGPSGSGPYTYSVTRNLDGSGANEWYAGDAVFNTGQTGKGFIDLYSTSGVLSGSGPTIVGNVRTGSAYNAIAPRWAIGELNGLCGNSSATYGAIFGNCAGGLHMQIDATNGIRVLDASNNSYSEWDMSGNVTLGIKLTGYPVTRITPTAIELGKYGSTPTISLDGSTGNASLAGNLNLASGGDIRSVGNFSLTSADGFVLQVGTSSSGFTAPRSIQWKNGSTPLATIGTWSNNSLRLHTDSVGASAGVRMSVGNTARGLFITAESDGTWESITNIVAQGQASVIGDDTLVQFVPVINALSGTPLSRIGTSTNPWGEIYGSTFYAGSTPGFTGTKVAGACTLTFSGGIVTNVTGC